MFQLIKKIYRAQRDFMDWRAHSSAGMDFFNGKTEKIKRCYVNYKHDLNATISYKFLIMITR